MSEASVTLSATSGDGSEAQEHNRKDLAVLFKGKQFEVDAWTFGTFSRRFFDERPPSPIEIVSDVRVEAVDEFLGGCQRREMNITLDNADELLELCDEWDVASLKEQVESFLLANSESTLIQSILRSKRRGLATSSMEKTLRSEFLSHMSNPRIFELGLEVLFGVFSLDDHSLVKEHVHEVFDFLMKSLEIFGSSGSVLFSGLSIDDLNESEMRRLGSSNNFDFGIFNDSMFNRICDLSACVHRILTQHQELVDQDRMLTDNVAKLQAENAQLLNERQQAKREMAEKKKELDDMHFDCSTLFIGGLSLVDSMESFIKKIQSWKGKPTTVKLSIIGEACEPPRGCNITMTYG